MMPVSFIDCFIKQFRRQALETHEAMHVDEPVFGIEHGVWPANEYFRRVTICKENSFSYLYGHLPIIYFNRCVDKDESLLTYCFDVAPEFRPSAAVQSIGREWCLLDSGSFYQAVFYRALCQFIGIEKFNCIFEGKLFINRNFSEWTQIFFEKVVLKSSKEALPGDRCCFKHLLSFSDKHALDISFYVLRTDDAGRPFLGFGLSPEGSTQVEVEKAMVEEYNKTPLITNTYFNNDTVTYEEFIRTLRTPPLEGRLELVVDRPRVGRIDQIARTSLEDLPELIESWQLPQKKQKLESHPL